MPTLPSSDFTEAVNANGVKQIVPKAWLEDGSPFHGQFRLTARAQQRAERSETPSENWTVPQLREHAERVGIDLTGTTTKADVLSAINGAQRGAEED